MESVYRRNERESRIIKCKTFVNVLDCWEENDTIRESRLYFALADDCLLITFQPYQLPITKITYENRTYPIYESNDGIDLHVPHDYYYSYIMTRLIHNITKNKKLENAYKEVILDKDLVQSELDHIKAYYLMPQ